MQSKSERASAIARVVLRAGEDYARIHARGREGLRNCVELTRNGWSARLHFTELASLLALLGPAPTETPEAGDWNQLDLRIGNQQKLSVRFRGHEMVPEMYAPGAWERQFGVEPGDDSEILLPSAPRSVLL